MSDEHRIYDHVDQDNPRLRDGAKSLIKQGYGDEHVIRIIGCAKETLERCKKEVADERKSK